MRRTTTVGVAALLTLTACTSGDPGAPEGSGFTYAEGLCTVDRPVGWDEIVVAARVADVGPDIAAVVVHGTDDGVLLQYDPAAYGAPTELRRYRPGFTSLDDDHDVVLDSAGDPSWQILSAVTDGRYVVADVNTDFGVLHGQETVLWDSESDGPPTVIDDDGTGSLEPIAIIDGDLYAFDPGSRAIVRFDLDARDAEPVLEGATSVAVVLGDLLLVVLDDADRSRFAAVDLATGAPADVPAALADVTTARDVASGGDVLAWTDGSRVWSWTSRDDAPRVLVEDGGGDTAVSSLFVVGDHVVVTEEGYGPHAFDPTVGSVAPLPSWWVSRSGALTAIEVSGIDGTDLSVIDGSTLGPLPGC